MPSKEIGEIVLFELCRSCKNTYDSGDYVISVSGGARSETSYLTYKPIIKTLYRITALNLSAEIGDLEFIKNA